MYTHSAFSIQLMHHRSNLIHIYVVAIVLPFIAKVGFYVVGRLLYLFDICMHHSNNSTPKGRATLVMDSHERLKPQVMPWAS
jgi:hypothetical protein